MGASSGDILYLAVAKLTIADMKETIRIWPSAANVAIEAVRGGLLPVPWTPR
jgi:hypothetical protein